MLVLARQLNERIVMPTVQATIEVVAIKPGSVRLGIDAPPDVTILREEVLRRGGVPPAALKATGDLDAETRLARVRHVLRNRLGNIALALDLLRQQLPAGPATGLDAMLQRMEGEVRTLDQQLKSLLAEPLDELPAPTVVSASCGEAADSGLCI